MTKTECIKAILFQLERCSRAYSHYRNDKVYLHARNIYKGNALIVKLIEQHGGQMDEPLKSELLLLLEHLDVWQEQFHQLENQLKPAANAVFVFERIAGTPAFPAHIKELLEKQLKEN